MFHTERLGFRAIEEADDALILRLHQDPEIDQNTGLWLPVPFSRDSAKKRREQLVSKCMLSAIIYLPATDGDENSNGTSIGMLSIRDNNIENGRFSRHVSLGIVIDREHWGKGYGREAVKWALNWAFRRAAMHKVSLRVCGYNANAIKLYESMGFVLEGKLRDEVWHDGRYWDYYAYSMLEGEWQRLYGQEEGEEV
ncbi:uncharacterized protein RHO25_007571 [Cercospora beticola]|uniref:N-acetyltransferase domain-containing protein n=1 Tax=Cercospora beticola TaxID=122368 RepID=A0ABZ0NTR4_CERBT|nr:hypothetical protein RHO25_007571 [Cercospora beticola]